MATEVRMPRLSDSMEEGTVVTWLVAEGDAVRRGQPLVEVETDKATMPYEAETDGVLLAILCGEGETAALGAPIAIIGAPGETLAEPSDAPGGAPHGAATANGNRAAAPTPAAVTAAAATRPARASARVAASPLARRVAQALGVDLSGVRGTGPAGRVTRADVEAAAASPVAAAAPIAPAPVDRPAPDEALDATRPAPAPATAPADGARGDVEVVPLTRLQQTVARRMAESRSTVPDFELRVDVDMAECVALRERLRALGADPLPSFNDMVVKAAALALREFPRVNGSYRDGAFEQYGRVNIGVAVAAQDALVVPAVPDADRASLGAIARATRELARKVRDGSITPPELSGATFTVSNLGMFGIDSFSAVINAPQAAILAVGALRKRPVVADGDRVVVHPVMTLTLACDHRILYGADGARFLARLRELLEQPLAFAL
jgi:pyruvate dehydrogenase E2 component (dihydrolipoamide acetyltransferase)